MGQAGQTIRCVTIDELMKQYGIDHIEIFKLDIEGDEEDVLGHASAWIDAVDIITAEFHDRIRVGCEHAFATATAGFRRFEKYGE